MVVRRAIPLRTEVDNPGAGAGVSMDCAGLTVVTVSTLGSSVVDGVGGVSTVVCSGTVGVSDGMDGRVGDAGVNEEAETDAEARVGCDSEVDSGSAVGLDGAIVGEVAVPSGRSGVWLWRLCRCECASASTAQTTARMKSANKSIEVIFDVRRILMQIGIDC